ncbi:hypothetical protein NEOKW01_0766 [Nematocida sp. AWRm80]|nr:hypothetical protein NEOKW01_0766 [Nematocida sp. AWRm80]
MKIYLLIVLLTIEHIASTTDIVDASEDIEDKEVDSSISNSIDNNSLSPYNVYNSVNTIDKIDNKTIYFSELDKNTIKTSIDRLIEEINKIDYSSLKSSSLTHAYIPIEKEYKSILELNKAMNVNNFSLIYLMERQAYSPKLLSEHNSFNLSVPWRYCVQFTLKNSFEYYSLLFDLYLIDHLLSITQKTPEILSLLNPFPGILPITQDQTMQWRKGILESIRNILTAIVVEADITMTITAYLLKEYLSTLSTDLLSIHNNNNKLDVVGILLYRIYRGWKRTNTYLANSLIGILDQDLLKWITSRQYTNDQCSHLIEINKIQHSILEVKNRFFLMYHRVIGVDLELKLSSSQALSLSTKHSSSLGLYGQYTFLYLQRHKEEHDRIFSLTISNKDKNMPYKYNDLLWAIIGVRPKKCVYLNDIRIPYDQNVDNSLVNNIRKYFSNVPKNLFGQFDVLDISNYSGGCSQLFSLISTISKNRRLERITITSPLFEEHEKDEEPLKKCLLSSHIRVSSLHLRKIRAKDSVLLLNVLKSLVSYQNCLAFNETSMGFVSHCLDSNRKKTIVYQLVVSPDDTKICKYIFDIVLAISHINSKLPNRSHVLLTIELICTPDGNVLSHGTPELACVSYQYILECLRGSTGKELTFYSWITILADKRLFSSIPTRTGINTSNAPGSTRESILLKSLLTNPSPRTPIME